MIHSCHLENGVRVILEPVEHTDVVSIGFWQLHGSRDENEHTRGFSHFLEHMLFKGTSKRTAYQIAQQIERVGGYINAFTEKELTCLYCTLPKDHTPLAIDILSDMITNSILDEREIEKEKLVIINEIKAIEDNPEEKGHELYLEQMWNGHSLSRRITGETKQIKKITRNILLDFYYRRFVVSNCIVTAGGKFNSETILEQLNQVFKQNGSEVFKTERIQPERQIRWETVRDKFQQVHIYTGTCFAPSKELKGYYKELVFSILFGESMSSRLFQRLREDEGLCYAVYSFRSYYTGIAQWTIYANTVPESVPRLIESLNKELKDILLDPPTDREVEDAKSQLKGNVILAKEDMENRMKRLLRQYILTGQVLEHQESLNLLDEVNQEDIVEVIQKMIKPNNFNLLVYGNRRIKSLSQTGFSF